MMSVSKRKAVLRWGGITLVALGYYVWLGLASLGFGHIAEKESVVGSGPVSQEYHRAIIGALREATGGVFDAAGLGFLVCVPLILLIFHKVR
ncbi:hypothetical protein WH06_23090 [Aeromonas salmonicida subsp. salmonicida]|nr:hypothetical protein BHR40_23375 [Aeromonas salmonicida subsp. salmonicida]OSM50279.1 hypothetical protein WH06_23090 [Aeromonas salmonicida subsp. salmonicida]